MQTRSVNVSDLATVRDIQEFFSFSGNIDHIDILKNAEQSRVAFVSFTEPKALEIALFLFVCYITSSFVNCIKSVNV
ncbi:unnamed protein product [Brassica oleracea var. botrytis]|uniref:BnaCnng35710D protein n=3 Tax=Brassica TaxID=3705 RepID=A0A078J8Z8_BRANA|nr:hypothetical protein HID58_060135 [Brassica napus]CAF1835654.1 unnamed protein product [Brassica napus]CDY60084.1 BnaCnng35710D [Brassica napus]VDD08787.1 unnamed protein product [Brassica oleracea]